MQGTGCLFIRALTQELMYISNKLGKKIIYAGTCNLCKDYSEEFCSTEVKLYKRQPEKT